MNTYVSFKLAGLKNVKICNPRLVFYGKYENMHFKLLHVHEYSN